MDAYFGSFPDNNEFNSTAKARGWYSFGTATSRIWSNLSEDGNPPGGLIIASTTRGQNVSANWTASFIYNKTGKVAKRRYNSTAGL